MIFPDDPLESIWDGLLSCNPMRIRATFTSILSEDRPHILAHLQRMVTENDWLPEQKHSAQSALAVLREVADQNSPPTN
jgi:hypothetical protein